MTRINLGTLDVQNHLLRELYGDPARFGVAAPNAQSKGLAAKVVLAIAGADGRVSPTERGAWNALCHVIGVPQETPSWGRMLSEASQHIESWWMMLFPGLMLLFLTLAFNLVGDGLRDALDPRTGS